MGHPLRLLIIDDRQPDAELSVGQIARGGYSCTWRRVETEEEFRTELREFAPDLILSDITLPQYNGLSALELAAAEAPRVPFIFVSGTLGEQRAAEALSRGASDYVHKGDPSGLVRAVARVLGEGKPRGRGGPGATAVNSSLLDPLTNLPRRAFFSEYLSHHLQRADASEITTVIVADIERLQAFNEAHGRPAGDKLIQCIAERLQRRFGHGAELAHFGGGTFAAVFAERRNRADATRDSATAIFGQQFDVDDRTIQVTVKCGLARYPGDGQDAESLLQHAEAVLDRIRERRERAATRAAPAADTPDARRPVLERRLRVALEERHFSLHYQPLIERVSGRITAVEALLRWRDSELGPVAPQVFLPVLERTGLILEVGRWVRRQAASDFERWHSTGLPRLRVAVNVSAVELARKDFATAFLEKTLRAHIPPCIDIEIPESALRMDLQLLRQTLRALRGEGVRIAVDHFGMSQASLSRLGELPVDSLKIDRSFISRLTSQPESQTIVTAILRLARSYGLRTVAEGVESIEQLKILDALGCEQSQGYLHSPAVSAEELALLVATRSEGED